MDSTPRVNKRLLSNYINNNVRIIGKILSLDSNQAILSLETSDKGTVQVKLKNSFPITSPMVEIIGKVKSDLTIEELKIIDLSFDFSNNLYI